MKKVTLYINVFCYLLIACFLAATLVTALQSGYPWAVNCYNCVLCRRVCPLGFDPYGFISAAITNDPDLYMPATNVRIRLQKAVETDPFMQLRLADGTVLTARQLVEQGGRPGDEVTVEKMKARHAARYCPLCGSCDKACPINLPVSKIIEDLRDDGLFNRR